VIGNKRVQLNSHSSRHFPQSFKTTKKLNEYSPSHITSAMSKTIQIASPSQFNDVLRSSAVVVVDCECAPRQTCKPHLALHIEWYLLESFIILIRSSLCRLVWPLQANSSHIRTIITETLSAKIYNVRKGQHRYSKRDCFEVQHFSVNTPYTYSTVGMFDNFG
jgi:hypothetical protein